MTTPGQRLVELNPDHYDRHPVHLSERSWTETNCYVDLWVELLHSLHVDPLPAASCVLSSGFEGDQWTFLKFTAEDLRDLYGIDVAEMNIWKPVVDHVQEKLAAGRWCTVEIDSFWLPDTAGTSYRTEHTKTTIVANRLDREARVVEYFHNAGYFTAEGDDFDGLFGLGSAVPAEVLPPYVERVDISHSRLALGPSYEDADLSVVRAHLSRRPEGNPVAELALRIRSDVEWLAAAGVEGFHLWSFGMLRQCGAAAELAADLCNYLEARGIVGAAQCSPEFAAVAGNAKVVQFQMARAARGRAVKLDEPLESMTRNWESAVIRLAALMMQ